MNKGFTLIEVIIVVIIIGLIATAVNKTLAYIKISTYLKESALIKKIIEADQIFNEMNADNNYIVHIYSFSSYYETYNYFMLLKNNFVRNDLLSDDDRFSKLNPNNEYILFPCKMSRYGAAVLQIATSDKNVLTASVNDVCLVAIDSIQPDVKDDELAKNNNFGFAKVNKGFYCYYERTMDDKSLTNGQARDFWLRENYRTVMQDDYRYICEGTRTSTDIFSKFNNVAFLTGTRVMFYKSTTLQ